MKKDLFTKWPPTLYTRAKTLLLLFPITQKVSSILFFFFFLSFSLACTRARTYRVCPSFRPFVSLSLSVSFSLSPVRPATRPVDQKGLESSPARFSGSERTLPCRCRRIVTVTPLISSFPSLARAKLSGSLHKYGSRIRAIPPPLPPSLPRTRSDRIGCLVPSDYQYRSAGPGPRAKPQHASGPVRFFSRLPAAAPRGAQRHGGQCARARASVRNEHPTNDGTPQANRRPSTAPLSRSNRPAPRGAVRKHGSREY